MKWKTQFNKTEFKSDAQFFTQKSLTIPDQTMSIREIMDRFARGLSIEDGKVPIYEGEDDYLPDLRTLDLSERAEILENTRREINEINNKYVRTRRNVNEDYVEQQIENTDISPNNP